MSSSKVWVGSKTALVWALSWFFASSAFADYQKSYRDGIEAFDRKRWGDVAQYMREAISERPRSGGSVKIYGMRFEPYTPHYYLGLALYHLKDYAGAVEAWDKAESYGVVKGGAYNDLKEKREEARAQLPRVTTPPPLVRPPAPPPPAPPPSAPPPPAPPNTTAEPPTVDPAVLRRAISGAEETLFDAQRKGQSLEELRNDPAYSGVFKGGGFAESLNRTNKQMDTARQLLASGRAEKDLQAIQEAGRLANRVAAERDDLMEQAVRRRDELATGAEQAQRQALLDELKRLEADASRQLADARQRASTPEIQRRQAELNTTALEIRSAGENMTVAKLTSLRDRARVQVTALRDALTRAEPAGGSQGESPPPGPGDPPPTKPQPPEVLKVAANAFLAADFEGVLQSLAAEESLGSPKARATALLLSAAARYALFLEGGRRDGELEKSAAADVVACRGLDPELKPTSQWFSPTFIRFFQKDRTSEQERLD